MSSDTAPGPGADRLEREAAEAAAGEIRRFWEQHGRFEPAHLITFGWLSDEFGVHVAFQRMMGAAWSDYQRAVLIYQRGTDTDLAGSAITYDGASFILDQPSHLEARVGRGGEVLWARGESLIVVGPTGVGKTTLAGEMVAGLIGITDEVIGYHVTPARRVLYLAMDRPRQVRRALARRFSEANRQVLTERLVVRAGPLPADLAKKPEQLLDLAKADDADVVVVDSLKDAAVKLSEDETGGNINRAVQLCNVHDVDLLLLHHQRKGPKPDTLADVYGSTWITAGAGSVVLLWGDAGSELVELRHLKPPADPVGPLSIEHDHLAGTCKVVRGFDVLAFVKLRAGSVGVTVADAAQAEHGSPQKPGSGPWKRTERRLRSLVKQGILVALESQPRTTGGTFGEVRYHLDGKPR